MLMMMMGKIVRFEDVTVRCSKFDIYIRFFIMRYKESLDFPPYLEKDLPEYVSLCAACFAIRPFS